MTDQITFAGKIYFSGANIDNNFSAIASGWLKATGASVARSSADDPTYQVLVTADDLTSKISVGMKMKMDQLGATLYFFVTAISVAAGNTTITLYGGTDYDLTTDAISNVFFSGIKAPFGFPMDMDKWTVYVSDVTAIETTPPTAGVWYNALSLTIPLGAWNVSFSGGLVGANATNPHFYFATLSKANNSEDDKELTVYDYDSNLGTVAHGIFATKHLTLAAKDIYYLNYSTASAACTTIQFGGIYQATIIKAVCAYL